MNRRSIGFPLALGIALVLIALALAVGWQLLVVADLEPVSRGLQDSHWLLIILGSVFFVLIIVGLLLLCVWLVREIRSNQRQQAFLDAVTHEMKTPLAALRLYLETLRRHDPVRERRLAFLGRMEEDVERLESTVNQLLAVARAETRRRRRPASVVDLARVVREVAAELRDRHGLAEEAIRIECDGPLPARGDAAELGVVFRNLLENAVKYSRGTVDVRVSLRQREDGRVAADITDRGIGIEPRELRRIFGRFYRAGRGMQRQAAGLGLGLFIVGHLVWRNGGRVLARSAGSGRGSRFTVVLRGASAAELAASESPPAATPTHAADGGEPSEAGFPAGGGA